VPFTRNCMNNKRKRKELGQQNKDKGLENLLLRYDILVDSVEENGFNPVIFDTANSTAAQVNRGGAGGRVYQSRRLFCLWAMEQLRVKNR
jgi:hypothetical protein